MASRIKRVLAVGPVRGAVEQLQQLLNEEAPGLDVDAVAVVGDLGVAWSKPATYRAVFRALGEADFPAFWVPGPLDAPISDYMRESYSMEVAFPHLRGVHGAAAVADAQLVFAGMGGEIVDDPNAMRVEEAVLLYPGWEAEYRLKLIAQLDQPLLVLLFATRPAHTGLHEPGSEVVAGLIKTYAPKVAIVAGEGAAEERLGTSLVVCPGRLDLGIYSVIDIHSGSVEVGELSPATTGQRE
jgi:Icc-related predicted phosphoesterase